MADKQEFVMVSAEQHAARQLAAEILEQKKAPLDETVPGGAYLRADGKTWENANGEVIDAPSAKEVAAVREAEGEREAKAAAPPVAVPAAAATTKRSTRSTRKGK